MNANFGMALSYIYAQEHFDDRAQQEVRVTQFSFSDRYIIMISIIRMKKEIEKEMIDDF